MIIVGYAGNDNSVMTVLEELVEAGEIIRGVYWCKPKGTKLGLRACRFMDKACSVNEHSAVVEIDDFDSLMYSLYVAMNLKNIRIDELWKDTDKNKIFCTIRLVGMHQLRLLMRCRQFNFQEMLCV